MLQLSQFNVSNIEKRLQCKEDLHASSTAARALHMKMGPIHTGTGGPQLRELLPNLSCELCTAHHRRQ